MSDIPPSVHRPDKLSALLELVPAVPKRFPLTDLEPALKRLVPPVKAEKEGVR